MSNTWEQALSVLKNEVNDQVYSAWFFPIKQVSQDNVSIVLGVPNKFFENWIKEKYISLLKTVIHEVSGKKLNIALEITGEVQNEIEAPDSTTFSSKTKVVSSSKTQQTDQQTEKESSTNWLKSVFVGKRSLPESQYQQIGFNVNYTFDNFVVGQSNRFAHAASLAVCENPSRVYNPLFLYGGVGLGKTHLMQATGQEILKKYPKSKVLYISSEEFTNQLINAIRTKTTPKFRSMYRNVDVLLIDDVQFIAGKESTQEEFFHTFNALHDSHKQIILCSDRTPQEIKDLEERLISRFAWGLIADIQLPDFETRIAIMEKKSEHEAVAVPKDVLYFLAENVKTNIREMEGALIRVVAYSKLTNTEMSVPLCKEVLKGMLASEEKTITIGFIQKKVAGFFDIKETDMKTKKRPRAISYPRQLAMYLSRELTDYSLTDIGSFFGGRDHTTVLHACEKIGKELEKNNQTKIVVDKLLAIVKS